jgi:hypothetical protein
MANVRDSIAEPKQLVDLLFVLCENELRFAIGEQIGDLLIEGVTIDAKTHRTDGMSGYLCSRPVGTVIADYRNDIACPQSKLDEA